MSVAGSLVGAVAGSASRWDFDVASRRGARLGRWAYRLDRRHREVALRNLQVAFPDASTAWRRQVARASFEQAGRTIFELMWSPRLVEVALDSVVRMPGLGHVHEALSGGSGVILASGHFGNWEVMGLGMARVGIPLVSIARPLDDPALDARLRDLRCATGQRILPKQDAVRGALRALREGSAVAVLMDQNTLKREAVFVPYFGRLAATTPVVAHLHMRTGAPILTAFAVPEEPGYSLVVDPPVTVPDEDREDAVQAITTAVTGRLEQRVREHPQAWLWMHDRWRERP